MPSYLGFFLILAFFISAQAVNLSGQTLVGYVEARGLNSSGQLNVPPGLTNVIAVAGGSAHSLALRADGTVVAWGNNSFGQLNVPAGLNNVVAIAAGEHSVALKSDGTVVVWGRPDPSVMNVPGEATSVIKIAAGKTGAPYTVALRSDGKVVAWGAAMPELTSVPEELSDVVDIDAGPNHVIALKSNGEIVTWGLPPATPENLTDVMKVRAGRSTSFAIRNDGSIAHWGGTSDGNAPPVGLAGVLDLQAGTQHAVALLKDNKAHVWGSNFPENVIAGINGVLSVAAGGNHILIITAQPKVLSITPAMKVNLGGTATFKVEAIGANLSYQWQFKGENLPGETSSTLTITNASIADVGSYQVVVSNQFGSVTSPATSLSFPPPVITAQPQSLTKLPGEEALFAVEATGIEPLTYEWVREAPGGQIVSLEKTLVLAKIQKAMAGNYLVVVRDAAGGTTVSSPALLEVVNPNIQRVTLLPQSDTSYSDGTVNPRVGETILAGRRGRDVVDRGLIRFDLSSIPNGAEIQSAFLRLTVVRVPPNPVVDSQFILYRVLKPWNEEATWFNPLPENEWAVPGAGPGTDYFATMSASTLVSGSGPYEFGPSELLLSDVVLWHTSPESNFGWLLKSDAEDVSRSARHFGSEESSLPPELIVEYDNVSTLLEIRRVKIEGGKFQFQMAAEPGRVLRLEGSNDLKPNSWVTISSIPSSTNEEPVAIEAPVESDYEFFRVRVD